MSTLERTTKEQVIERDRVCIRCGRGDGVEVHEIVPRSQLPGDRLEERLFCMQNRCVVCFHCHAQVHTRPGRVELIRIMRDRYNYDYSMWPWQYYCEECP